MKPALSDEEFADNTDSSDSKPEFNDDEDDHVDTDIDDEEEEEEEDYEDDEEAPHVRQPPPDHEDIAEEGNNKKYTFNRGRIFIICSTNIFLHLTCWEHYSLFHFTFRLIQRLKRNQKKANTTKQLNY